MLYIYPVVEGQGDERAAPVLIRNLLNRRFNCYDITVLHPYRMPKGKMKIVSEWPPVCGLVHERLSDVASSSSDYGVILVMCDADDDCPVQLKAQIESFFIFPSNRFDMHFVAPSPEFETWFLAGANSFLSHKDCVDIIPAIANLDQIGDAKGYFERNILKPNRYYAETVDQAKFSDIFDFQLNPEKRCRSLLRFVNIFDHVVRKYNDLNSN